jgi:hypothetical protein
MEASAISNLPIANPPGMPVEAQAYGGSTAPAVGTNAAGSTNANGAGENAKETPAFAQVIREMLVRTAGESAALPARPLRSNSFVSGKSGSGAVGQEQQKSGTMASSRGMLPIVANVNVAAMTSVAVPVEAAPTGALPVESVGSTDAKAAVTEQQSAPLAVMLADMANGADAQREVQELGLAATETQAKVEKQPTAEAGSNPTTSDLRSGKGAVIAWMTAATPTVALEQVADARLATQMAMKSAAPVHGEPVAKVIQQIERVQLPGTTGNIFVETSGTNATERTAGETLVTPEKIVLPPNGVLPGATAVPLAAAGTATAKPVVASMDATKNATPISAVETPQQNHSEGREGAANGDGKSSGDGGATKDAPVSTAEAAAFSQAFGVASVEKVDSAAVTTTPTAAVAVPTPAPTEHAPAQSAAASLPAAPSPSNPNPTSADTTAIHIANDAQLMQTATHSEMRIAMQTEKFGAVELHARVAGDEIGAAITVEKKDAHAALAMELPALQQALSDKQMRVDQIALLHGSLGSTAGDAGAHAQQGERGAGTRGTLPGFQGNAEKLATGALITPEQLGAFDAQGRLSVLA